LSKNKIEIRDVKISVILEQYLQYLDEMKKIDLEIASEFVSMASHLIYIKAKMLVAPEDEPITELELLMQSLEELKRRDGYARIKFAAEFLSACQARGTGFFTKPPEPAGGEREYNYSHGSDALLIAMLEILKQDKKEAELAPERLIPEKITYSVEKKTEEILQILRQRGAVKIRELLSGGLSRTELVATFVSVLELCKMGSIIFIGTDENLSVSCAGKLG
jgi:segregation and condensation protein A